MKRFFLFALFHALPLTRFFRFKAWLLRLMGFQCAPSARVVSSVRIAMIGPLSVGDDTYLGHEVFIAGGDAPIAIGSHCDFAPRVMLVGGTHAIDMDGPHSAGEGVSKPIRIEDGVWIGASSTVLGGVTIGRKSIIAAGSLVKDDIPPFVIAAGVPCRPIKRYNFETKLWERI